MLSSSASQITPNYIPGQIKIQLGLKIEEDSTYPQRMGNDYLKKYLQTGAERYDYSVVGSARNDQDTIYDIAFEISQQVKKNNSTSLKLVIMGDSYEVLDAGATSEALKIGEYNSDNIFQLTRSILSLCPNLTDFKIRLKAGKTASVDNTKEDFYSNKYIQTTDESLADREPKNLTLDINDSKENNLLYMSSMAEKLAYQLKSVVKKHKKAVNVEVSGYQHNVYIMPKTGRVGPATLTSLDKEQQKFLTAQVKNLDQESHQNKYTKEQFNEGRNKIYKDLIDHRNTGMIHKVKFTNNNSMAR